MRYKKTILYVCLSVLAWPALSHASGLGERLAGQILLQVQSHGEAWYVNPKDQRRYYMKDGAAAYQIMRYLSLGISDADYARLIAGDAALKQRLLGRILLRVQEHGEAYYVCPRDKNVIYMKDGATAYQIMRNCSLGITNADLGQITTGSLSLPAQTTSETSGTTQEAPTLASNVQNGSSPTIQGCMIYPADNLWNRDVSELPVHASSQAWIDSIGATRNLHPDFGGQGEYGIPFSVVPGNQTRVPINFTAYGDESDPGPYPVPADAKVEGGEGSDGDRHVIVLDKDNCKLYELYRAFKNGNGWDADSGAIFDLASNALRPYGWTSADAAGLPILPGLVRYDEVAAGAIDHAIRFTAPHTQNGWIAPATHQAGSNNPSLPPMGARFRLKANYDISNFSGEAKAILEAMKKYGMILADNGSAWYFQGDGDPRWDDDDLNQLKSVPGSAFEAVYTGDINR